MNKGPLSTNVQETYFSDSPEHEWPRFTQQGLIIIIGRLLLFFICWRKRCIEQIEQTYKWRRLQKRSVERSLSARMSAAIRGSKKKRAPIRSVTQFPPVINKRGLCRTTQACRAIVRSGEKYKTTRWRAASCFWAIKHFHFQFLVGAERRGAVGGQPVADDRWFVYRQSLCSSTDPLSPLPAPLPLLWSSRYHVFHPSTTPALSSPGLFVASIFFVVFHFEQPRFTPLSTPSTIPPFESPSRIERIPSNYLTLRTVASVCLVEIRQNPALSEHPLFEVTVSSIILLSSNTESQHCTTLTKQIWISTIIWSAQGTC